MRVEEEREAGFASPAGSRLPARDYLLLPFLSLTTIAVLFGFGSVGASMYWPKPLDDTCTYWSDQYGPLDKANCRGVERVHESPETVNVFNACGYRQLTGCGPKPPDAIRIALLGSSMAEGLLVPMQGTVGALLERDLHGPCGRVVEVEQMGTPLQSPMYSLRRIPEAIALQADLVVLVVTPIDVESLDWYLKQAHEHAHRIEVSPAGPLIPHASMLKRVQGSLANSDLSFSLEHLLFRNSDLFARLYLMYGDKADFLRQPFTPAWEERFQDLDWAIGGMAEQLRLAGIPFFVTAAPSRANAALLRNSSRFPGVDPFAWGRRVAQISESHGAHYIDMLKAFENVPRGDLMYYPVDGHMNALGQPVMSRTIAKSVSEYLPHCKFAQLLTPARSIQ